MTERRKISDIVVGTRHRKDMGDIEGLAATIRDIGALMHPIVIRPDNKLVAGERRLRAAKLLGWKTIPVTVVDIAAIARGEYVENITHKPFTPSELVAIGEEVERIERELAKERERHGGRGKRSGKLPDLSKGDTRDKVAVQLGGISGRTYEKAKVVVKAAEAEPERFGHLIEELDRYRGVDRAYRALRIGQDERRILNLAPVAGKYRTLVIDPPWEYDMDFLGRGAPQYALMDEEQLRALPVSSWAEANCHLYLWATNALMPKAIALVPHWGFEHKTIITWKKPHYGLGAYFRGQTEHVLFAVRGQLGIRRADIPTIFEAPTTRMHSEKPEKFYEIVRAASYPPYGEAFQRKARPDFVNLYVPSREAAE
jgi:N6-adenosine-specific RNA methylase IME4